MATERIRTVKSAGGDYTSLSAWEAGEVVDIVALDEIRIAECYAFSDTTTVSITGGLSDATRYFKITVPLAERHAGAWSASKYRLEVADANGISLGEEFIRIEYIQVSVSESSTTARNAILTGTILAGGDIRIEQTIIRQAPGSSGTGNLAGIFVNDTDAVVKLANVLVYDFQQGTARGINLGAGVINAYHCGSYNNEIGYRRGAGTFTTKNCWDNASTDGWNGTFDAASNYNLSELAADAPGANSKNSTAITFVDEAGDDFHLNASDTAAGASGTDLGGNPAVDIDGLAYASWSGVNIGPDQFAAGGGDGAAAGFRSLLGVGK